MRTFLYAQIVMVFLPVWARLPVCTGRDGDIPLRADIPLRGGSHLWGRAELAARADLLYGWILL